MDELNNNLSQFIVHCLTLCDGVFDLLGACVR